MMGNREKWELAYKVTKQTLEIIGLIVGIAVAIKTLLS